MSEPVVSSVNSGVFVTSATKVYLLQESSSEVTKRNRSHDRSHDLNRELTSCEY